MALRVFGSTDVARQKDVLNDVEMTNTDNIAAYWGICPEKLMKLYFLRVDLQRLKLNIYESFYRQNVSKSLVDTSTHVQNELLSNLLSIQTH